MIEPDELFLRLQGAEVGDRGLLLPCAATCAGCSRDMAQGEAAWLVYGGPHAFLCYACKQTLEEYDVEGAL
jgi:hypothetical protein